MPAQVPAEHRDKRPSEFRDGTGTVWRSRRPRKHCRAGDVFHQQLEGTLRARRTRVCNAVSRQNRRCRRAAGSRRSTVSGEAVTPDRRGGAGRGLRAFKPGGKLRVVLADDFLGYGKRSGGGRITARAPASRASRASGTESSKVALPTPAKSGIRLRLGRKIKQARSFLEGKSGVLAGGGRRSRCRTGGLAPKESISSKAAPKSMSPFLLRGVRAAAVDASKWVHDTALAFCGLTLSQAGKRALQAALILLPATMKPGPRRR